GRHVLLVSTSVSPWFLVPVALVRRVLGAGGAYGMGLIYGPAAIRWLKARSPRFVRPIDFLQRWFERIGPPIFLPLPMNTLCAIAGVARTPSRSVFSALTLSHLLWIGGTLWLGGSIQPIVEAILDFLADHLVVSTLVCVALVGLHQAFLWARRKRRRAARGAKA
ncbi:MAG: hypothetical protein KC416_15770, partial [Myxococcales bacterium]|nr:hypothetical protein [Myxococcales bacterium]